jgi:sugar lactone lactonase YvrE
MKFLTERRCVIGEGPIYNEKNGLLYFTNGMGDELCTYDPKSEDFVTRSLDKGCAAYAFSEDGRLICSRHDGVFYLNDDNSVEPLYDSEKYDIKYANDMKVGPDGRLYVGTQSGKRFGVSDKIDGKLYSIDKDGKVKVLLDGIILSNGLEWSMDEKKFYHTDSDTNIIKEYNFDAEKGEISFTGREVFVKGVDGFTIDKNGTLIVASCRDGCLYEVDTDSLEVISGYDLAVGAAASCGFFGENMDMLAVTTASYHVDIEKDENAGYTWIMKRDVGGRKPYLFGKGTK